MKAHLVYIDLLVRVELPDNATEEEIQDAAADKAVSEARQEGGFSWMRENISDWKEDTEVPAAPSPTPIGFQIESADGTHEIPDEFHSFEIMSYHKAERWMIDNPCAIKWMIVPVFEGDIEDPTFLD